ncbi:MAG: CoA pyrophosphatase [Chloroflexi bacterium]|nr:CoA pyrophosphatase [Chloroflexota bacterium]
MLRQAPVTIETVRAAMQLPLPGRAAQQTMAVRPRPGDRPDLPNPCPREGAVLVLLYEQEGNLVLPLTYRTETVELHKGQISLPGGAREPQDESFADTAVRETSEELGIPREAIELLGTLTPLYIPVSRFCVYPYVGYATQPFDLHFDPNEVLRVIEVPVELLLDPSTRQIETHFRDNQRFEVPVYAIASYKVWGATAMILAEFLALVRMAQRQESA